MKQRLGIAFSLTLAAALLTAAIASAGDGATALSLSLQSSDPTIQQAALREVWVGGSAMSGLASDILPLLRDRDTYTRYYAARALGQLGSCSETVVDALAPLLTDKSRDVRQMTIESLTKCGARAATAAPAVAKALTDPDDDVRLAALDALEAAGPPAYREWRHVLPVARNEPALRADAVTAIGEMTGAYSEFFTNKDLPEELRAMRIPAAERVAAVGAAAEFLGDPDIDVRIAALGALTLSDEVGFERVETVDGILAAAADPQEEVRQNAIELLERLAKKIEGDDALPAAAEAAHYRLLGLVSDEVAAIRIKAALALSRVWATPEALEAFEELLEDRSHEVRAAATEALYQHEGSGASAATVAKLLADPVESVRHAAAFATREFEQNGLDEAVTALVAASARERSGSVRSTIAWALGSICDAVGKSAIERRGEACAAAAGALYRLLADQDVAVRVNAATGLHSLAPYAELRAEPLRQALKDRSRDVRSYALQTIQTYGPDTAGMFADDVIARLEDDDETLRMVAARVLEVMPPQPAAISALQKQLADPSPDIRGSAARALGEYGEAAKATIPALLAALQNVGGDGETTNEKYRIAIGEALGRIDTASIPLIEEAVRKARERIAAQPLPNGDNPWALLARDTTDQELEAALNAAKRARATSTYTAATLNGSPATLSAGGRQAVIAMASWCPISRELDFALKHPLLQPYLRNVKVQYLFADETDDIRKGLEQAYAEDGSDADPETVIRALPATPTGARLFDFAFFERSQAQSFFVAAGAKGARSFPSTLDIDTGEFDGYALDWLEELTIPYRVLKIAQRDAKQALARELGRGGDE